jgi:hypothetical protein
MTMDFWNFNWTDDNGNTNTDVSTFKESIFFRQITHTKSYLPQIAASPSTYSLTTLLTQGCFSIHSSLKRNLKIKKNL